jgi:hypothetical protein
MRPRAPRAKVAAHERRGAARDRLSRGALPGNTPAPAAGMPVPIRPFHDGMLSMTLFRQLIAIAHCQLPTSTASFILAPCLFASRSCLRGCEDHARVDNNPRKAFSRFPSFTCLCLCEGATVVRKGLEKIRTKAASLPPAPKRLTRTRARPSHPRKHIANVPCLLRFSTCEGCQSRSQDPRTLGC